MTVKPTAQTTFFDTVRSELDSPLFAVSLKYHAPGSYDFGYLDKSKYTGSITYADVDSADGFWKFTADGYAVGDGAANSSPIPAIAGTYIYLSPSIQYLHIPTHPTNPKPTQTPEPPS